MESIITINDKKYNVLLEPTFPKIIGKCTLYKEKGETKAKDIVYYNETVQHFKIIGIGYPGVTRNNGHNNIVCYHDDEKVGMSKDLPTQALNMVIEVTWKLA